MGHLHVGDRLFAIELGFKFIQTIYDNLEHFNAWLRLIYQLNKEHGFEAVELLSRRLNRL